MSREQVIAPVKKYVSASSHGGMVAVVSNDYSNAYVRYPDYLQLQARNAEMAAALHDQRWQHAQELKRAESLQTKLSALLAGIEGLADDFQGCGDHSRHKQAAEAWHYCAGKLKALADDLKAFREGVE